MGFIFAIRRAKFGCRPQFFAALLTIIIPIGNAVIIQLTLLHSRAEFLERHTDECHETHGRRHDRRTNPRSSCSDRFSHQHLEGVRSHTDIIALQVGTHYIENGESCS